MTGLDADLLPSPLGQPQRADRAAKGRLPFGGILAVREGRDRQSAHFLHFEFGQDERGIFIGGEKQNHRPFHQVEAQASEMRQRGTGVQDDGIQPKRRERGGEFVESSHVVTWSASRIV